MQKKKILTLVCLLLLIVLGGEVMLSAFAVYAVAADEPASFDDTNIEDDMAQMDEARYPANLLGKCDIVAFMEYAYSDYCDYSRVFNLYFYVYNPTEKPIYLGDGSNKVQMVTAFQGDSSAPMSYEKLPIEYVDKTDNNRFYKFKLADSSRMLELAKQYAAAHGGIRKYIITGVEIAHEAGTPIDYDISKTYDWSGYAAYCDAELSLNNTLECRDYSANSIPLEVRHTNYRFAEKDDYLYDDLSSVYFSIPDEYFQSWGDLTQIKTEWYEYLTAPMFVTSDKGAYTGLWEMRGKRINEFGQLIDENGNVLDSTTQSYWRVFWNEFQRNVGGDVTNYFEYSYNVKCRLDIDDDTYWDSIWGDDSDSFDLGSIGEDGKLSSDWFSLSMFAYLFYIEGVNSSDSYRVSSDEVKEYMRKYTSTFYQEELVRGYAASLFDLEKSPGYKEHTFNITDSEAYLDKDQDQSWWNEFWFGTKIEKVPFSPIVTISEGDLVLDTSDFSAKYLVDEKDASGIIDYARRSYSNGERPMLLRFACRDYYASTARFDYAEEDSFDMSDHDGYVAQEYVYLDFDVISLTFTSKDGKVDTVIGAVCTPIDVINGLTPPEDLVQEQEWWQILVALLGIIILLSLLSMIFPGFRVVLNIIWAGCKGILKFLCSILTLPFKVVRALVRQK